MAGLAKRFLDIIASASGIVLLSPAFVIVALAIRVSMGSPVIFRQPRIGLNEKTFVLYKFRTMRTDGEGGRSGLSDSQRLTGVGRVLRRTSLDELPQLWNVLRGDMSLVGPRPLFTHYLPFYTERELKRHAVRPGITGLAQVSGRNHLLWDDRLELDVRYVETRSFMMDLRLLLKTAQKVIRREDVVDVPGTLQGPLNMYRTPRSEVIDQK